LSGTGAHPPRARSPRGSPMPSPVGTAPTPSNPSLNAQNTGIAAPNAPAASAPPAADPARPPLGDRFTPAPDTDPNAKTPLAATPQTLLTSFALDALAPKLQGEIGKTVSLASLI